MTRGSTRPEGEGRQDDTGRCLLILEDMPERFAEYAAEACEKYCEALMPMEAIRSDYDHAPLTDEALNVVKPEVNRIKLVSEFLEIAHREESQSQW